MGGICRDLKAFGGFGWIWKDLDGLVGFGWIWGIWKDLGGSGWDLGGFGRIRGGEDLVGSGRIWDHPAASQIIVSKGRGQCYKLPSELSEHLEKIVALRSLGGPAGVKEQVSNKCLMKEARKIVKQFNEKVVMCSLIDLACFVFPPEKRKHDPQSFC